MRFSADRLWEAIPTSFLKKYRSAIPAVTAIALLYVVFLLLGIGCPIKFITGVSCAGCGMTRAWLHVLHLDLSAAFYFHPLFWAVPVVAVLFFLRKRFPRFFRAAVWAAAALFIAVYFVRMFDRSCDIVVFEPYNSVFHSIVRTFSAFVSG